MTQPQETEAFIATLARAPAPEPLRRGRMALRVGTGLALGLAAVLALLGIRPDLGAALTTPVVAAKTVVPLLLALFALTLTFATTHPGRRAPLWPLLLPLALALALFLGRALDTPPADWRAELLGHTVRACLLSITTISAAPLVLGLAALRRGASTRPALTGGLWGLAVGALATVGYTLHCNEDLPMFYVAWYGLAILIAGAVGAVAGARVLRW